VASLVALLVLGPFASRPLPHFPAFAPADSAWAILCALITTLLLLREVGVAQSKAVLVLSLGYLLTALAAITQFLTRFASFSPLDVAGPGSGASRGMVLLSGALLPAAVILYSSVDRPPAQKPQTRARGQSWSRMQITAVLGVTSLLVLGWGAAPLVVMGSRTLAAMISGAADQGALLAAAPQCAAILHVLALGALIRRGFKTRLDLWLFVVLLASLGQVVLSDLLSGGTFDLGWYAGMGFGAAASGALMVALLYESANHFEQLAEMHAALLASNRSLEHLSLHDSLTGLANRRHFDSYLARQVTLMRRNRRPLALVLCDLDNFKDFNDLHGHQAGDDCLARIAVALQACCRRPADMAARYGGEEFALVLPETDLAGAVRIADAAREAVSRLKITHARASVGTVMTMSGGVAVLDSQGDGSADSLVGAADAALFEAKRQGRDRIVSSKREMAGI
jgi:diguanylate cyclase (GGDEF)-like protein